MSNDTNHEITRLIQELVKRSTAEQVHTLQRVNQLLQRVSHGDLDQKQIQEEFMQFARSESNRYVNDLARLSLSFYNAFLELNSNYNERFFSQVSGEVYRDSAGMKRPWQQVNLALTGVVGQEIVRSFVIENKQAAPADISFLVSEFTDSANPQDVFRPSLQLEPARCTLRPGEERVVKLRLPLLPALFAAGRQYQATVVVRGYDDLTLALTVTTLPTDPDEEEIPVYETRPPQTTPLPDEPDDLTQIKGIGPALENRLQAAGVTTFALLSQLPAAQIAQLLGQGVQRQAERQQWQEQARLAATGNITGLAQLQAQLPAR
jgi:hypothetical protein